MTPCADPAALLTAAEAAVFELRVEDAHTRLDELEGSLACARVDPDALARFLLVEGALAMYEGDATGASSRFQAARALDPTPPDAAFGKKVKAAWDAAPRAAIDAKLELTPPVTEGEVRVDGRPVTPPLSVTSGLHLVQVEVRGALVYGELVLVPSEETLSVTGHRLPMEKALAPPPAPIGPAPAPGPAPVAGRGGPRLGLLATSAAMIAVGGVSAGLALRQQNHVIPDAPTLDAVDAALGRQRLFGWSAYGLWGGAVVVGGLAFF